MREKGGYPLVYSFFLPPPRNPLEKIHRTATRVINPARVVTLLPIEAEMVPMKDRPCNTTTIAMIKMY
jgi:hypothetical protein